MDFYQKVLYPIVGRFVKETKKEEKTVCCLAEALDIKAREVISLVGAGGKTSVMFRLSGELVLKGKRVLTTTTTKILEPHSEETTLLFIDPDEERLREFVRSHLDHYHHITLAKERLGSGKLRGISPSLVDDLWSLPMADIIIVEADGAKGHPVKAPREGEPVIPSKTTLVVAVLGMDGVELELNDENVFQAERVSGITGIPLGEKITEEAMAALMTHPEGISKGAPSSSRIVALLNKVDIPQGITKARRVASKIFEKGSPRIERVVLGQVRSEPPFVEVIFPGH